MRPMFVSRVYRVVSYGTGIIFVILSMYFFLRVVVVSFFVLSWFKYGASLIHLLIVSGFLSFLCSYLLFVEVKVDDFVSQLR